MWVVAVTKPQRELWGETNVKRQGHNTYLPLCLETTVHRGKLATRTRCLFPRYLFVEIDGPWHFLFSTFGLTGVVLNGEQPAPLPPEEIDQLRARENEDGLIVLPPPPAPPRYSSGQVLRVTYGPLSGRFGVCEGDDARARVKLLLQFLGRKSHILIARDAVRAADQGELDDQASREVSALPDVRGSARGRVPHADPHERRRQPPHRPRLEPQRAAQASQ